MKQLQTVLLLGRLVFAVALVTVGRSLPAQQIEGGTLFEGIGVVVTADPDNGQLDINHEAIQRLMDAMEMIYRVEPATLLVGLHPGDKIRFTVDGRDYKIIKIELIERAR